MDSYTILSFGFSFFAVLFLAWKVGAPLLGPDEPLSASMDDTRSRVRGERAARETEDLREDFASGKITSEEFQKNEARLLKNNAK